MKYRATITHLNTYEHGGRTFQNVYVADLNLEWGSICGGTCGIGFTRNKLVVFDEQGNVLEMFVDAEANRRFWVS